MRVMITVWPQMAHLYPLIPYAQALQNAGHEVCVACPPGAADDIVAAGLTSVVCGDPEPQSMESWARPDLKLNPEELESLAAALDISPAERDHWDVFYQYYLISARYHLPPEPSKDNEILVDFARSWQPDLVLWDPWFPIGGVVARASGAAHARILMAPDYSGWALEQFARQRGRLGSALPENPLVGVVRPLAERYGIEVDDELLLGQWTIDPLPPRMRLSRDITSVPVRWIPYNGGAVKPEWLYERPRRPRVALSLGVSTRAYNEGEWRTPKIMEAVDGLDIEVVATLDEKQLAGLDRIPENVRTVPYVPLVQLLPTCSAIINHGSSGTFWASVATRVPQIITDTDEPQRLTITGEGETTEVSLPERHLLSWPAVQYVGEHGAGARLDHQKQSAAEIRALILAVLNEPSYRKGAKVIHDEWLAKPSPAEIIPELERLTELHRPRS